MTKEEMREKYSPWEIAEIFKCQEVIYATEDAEYHIEEFCEWRELPEDEQKELHSYAEDIARDYLYKYSDPNEPENAVYEELVRKYYDEKVKPKEDEPKVEVPNLSSYLVVVKYHRLDGIETNHVYYEHIYAHDETEAEEMALGKLMRCIVHDGKHDAVFVEVSFAIKE